MLQQGGSPPEALRRYNPGEIMIRKKDCNILNFIRKLFAADPRMERLAK